MGLMETNQWHPLTQQYNLLNFIEAELKSIQKFKLQSFIFISELKFTRTLCMLNSLQSFYSINMVKK